MSRGTYKTENNILDPVLLGTMGRASAAVILFAILFLATVAAVASAEVHDDVHLEEGYTGESRTTQVDIVLKGEEVVSADFVFTVLDDVFESESDSFIFTITPPPLSRPFVIRKYPK